MKSIEQLRELQTTLDIFAAELSRVEEIGRAAAACLKAGGQILTCGNGGSATDAAHLAEELSGRYKNNRRALAAICLCADAAAMTCIANDFGYDAVFARQIEAIGRPGDMVFGFTTSGQSPNVLQAFSAAKERGMISVLVSGKDGGKAAGICDYEIIVPSQSTARIQEVHTFVLHQWLEIIEAELFGG